MNIVYPASLPSPTAAPLRPAERRLGTELAGPRAVRGIQRDYLGTQRVEFVYSNTQAAAFGAWYRDDLVHGGAWFASDWPTQEGWHASAVRRFTAPPSWQLIPGYGWRVSAECEVRGRGMVPVTVSRRAVLDVPWAGSAADVSADPIEPTIWEGSLLTIGGGTATITNAGAPGCQIGYLTDPPSKLQPLPGKSLTYQIEILGFTEGPGLTSNYDRFLLLQGSFGNQATVGFRTVSGTARVYVSRSIGGATSVYEVGTAQPGIYRIVVDQDGGTIQWYLGETLLHTQTMALDVAGVYLGTTNPDPRNVQAITFGRLLGYHGDAPVSS